MTKWKLQTEELQVTGKKTLHLNLDDYQQKEIQKNWSKNY